MDRIIVTGSLVYDFKIEYEIIEYCYKCWHKYDKSKNNKIIQEYNNDDVECFVHNLCKTVDKRNLDKKWTFYNDYVDKHMCRCDFCVDHYQIFTLCFIDDKRITITIKQSGNNMYIFDINSIDTTNTNYFYIRQNFNIKILVDNTNDEKNRYDYLIYNDNYNFENFLLGMSIGYDPESFKTIINYNTIV